ncbi:MAG: hypothetical protein J6P71_00625 [Oscillospiraceae bacterium]|nr:hypothetical protein [Oscillospiraceae bacterium]
MIDRRLLGAGACAAALILTLAAGGAGEAPPPAGTAAVEAAEPSPEEFSVVVRERGGAVCVFLAGYDAQPAIVTEISVEALPAADRELLAAGMTVEGREALLRLLEDLGS